MTEEGNLKPVRYTQDMSKAWNDFVALSKNATFLFDRRYMDYHADRFEDCSLMFYKNNRLRALLPACRIGDAIYSHAGLTYGGLIMDSHTTVEEVLEIFDLLKFFYKGEGIKEFYYKPVPYIYCRLPSEEDLYALFRHDGRLVARNVSSVVCNSERLKMRNIRKSGIRKAEKEGVKIKETDDYSTFWEILSRNLEEKYGAAPVHSLAEIEKLHILFPNNIRLFLAGRGDQPLAGTVCYINRQVVHCQYISASHEGKECGALDLLFSMLLDKFQDNYSYFDFGTSNEDGGNILNRNLIYQKEGFGGRAVCYDTYKMEL